jgi:hypothetical protein
VASSSTRSLEHRRHRSATASTAERRLYNITASRKVSSELCIRTSQNAAWYYSTPQDFRTRTRMIQECFSSSLIGSLRRKYASLDLLYTMNTQSWVRAKEGRILIGIVYLFPIFPVKMTLHERQNLDLLPQLFRSHPLCNSRIFPTTTRWDMCSPTVGERREAELCQKFWSFLLPDGIQPHRFSNSKQSAQNIIRSILSQYTMAEDPKSYALPLAIQQEQVDGRTRPHFISRLLTKQRRPLEAQKRSLILCVVHFQLFACAGTENV